MNCCCVYGSAVSGEYPEFARQCCDIHGLDEWADYDKCRRHKDMKTIPDNWTVCPLTGSELNR